MRIEMIKPLEGQSNWSNAINGNFQKLMTQLKSTLSEMQQLRREIEGLDSLQIQADNFLYITPVGANTKTYVVSYDDWTNPTDRDIEFKPEEYIGYLAWFVQTPDNTEVAYQGYSWKTGDLLIVYKQSISTIDNSIQQWKNIMGGYFLPEKHEIDENTGKVTTKYNRAPSLSTESTTELFNPAVCWHPDTYNANNGKMVFKPYYVDDNGERKLLNCRPVQVDMIFPVPGGSSYGVLYYEGSATHTISFNIDEGDLSSEYRTGFDIHFSDPSGNILYLPYTHRFDSNKLYITIQRGTYTGNIHIRVNVFKPTWGVQ